MPLHVSWYCGIPRKGSLLPIMLSAYSGCCLKDTYELGWKTLVMVRFFIPPPVGGKMGF
jgi:hypothetical protein